MGTTVFKICICRDMLSVSCADPDGGDRGSGTPPKFLNTKTILIVSLSLLV